VQHVQVVPNYRGKFFITVGIAVRFQWLQTHLDRSKHGLAGLPAGQSNHVVHASGLLLLLQLVHGNNSGQYQS